MATPLPHPDPGGSSTRWTQGSRPPARGHTVGYRLYAAVWGLVGTLLAIAGLPGVLTVQRGVLGLLVALSAMGNLIVVRFPKEVVFTMQGPVALAGVWLAGWPVALPVNLVSAAILAATQRASVWRAVLYFGNATCGLYAADRVFRSLAPGRVDLAASPAVVAALLLGGTAFGILTGIVVSLGRFLDSGDREHLNFRRWAVLAGSAVVLYVPLSYLMAVALRAGSAGSILALSVWVLASLAVKGFSDAREANLRLELALRSLEEVAVTDPLTGLFNRRRFEEAIAWECLRSSRSGKATSLLIVDVRGLKQVNDVSGHQVGDALLQAVASALRQSIRATDMAFRIGGDEFAVLLPETGSAGASLVAQALVDEAARHYVDAGGKRIRPALTVGTAAFPDDGTSPHQVVAAADRALYRARGLGRAVGQASGPLASPSP